ncbi:MAG: tRNA pseudouridine(38-40) synthase TruA [Firmicutes bacterium]|nr:tRNA pseudouridine(38-40) synthase TruA [Bacillota bacterium]
MVFKFTCEYNGKNYQGFQRQNNGPSVQAVLEDALGRIFSQKIVIAASGRTDTGVHAMGQVCSFVVDTDMVWDLYKLAGSVNAFLPDDVAVRDFEIMEDGFNARFSVKSKSYIYRCYVGQVQSPLRDGFMLQLYKMPEVGFMQDAAKLLVGTHDFTSFSNVNTDKVDKVRTVTEFDVKLDGDEITFKISGNGFLRNMVRILVGTLLDVGYGKISVDDIKAIIDSKDREKAGQTVAAKGLYLMKVEY